MARNALQQAAANALGGIGNKPPINLGGSMKVPQSSNKNLLTQQQDLKMDELAFI